MRPRIPCQLICPSSKKTIASTTAPVEPKIVAPAAPEPSPRLIEDSAIARAQNLSKDEMERIDREYQAEMEAQAAKRAKEDAERWHDPFPGLPAELKSHNRWGLFKKNLGRKRKQKYDKIPYRALTGQMGNFFEKDKGADYWAACNFFRKNPAEWGGIGYGFNKEYGFTGIDLDDCIDPVTHEIEPWAVEICEKLNSYTEQSLSGNGLHIVVRWTMPARSDNKEGVHVNPVEIYSGKHFFAMTGLSLSDYPDDIRDADLINFAQALENGDYRKFDKKKLTQETQPPQQEKDGNYDRSAPGGDLSLGICRRLRAASGQGEDINSRIPNSDVDAHYHEADHFGIFFWILGSQRFGVRCVG